MDFIPFIKEVSTKAGWEAIFEVSETMVRLPFEDDAGEINVFIRPCGEFDEQTVLEFSSVGFPLPEDNGLRLALLEMALERNGQIMQGYWAIEEGNNEKKLTVMATQIAETMDPPEFKTSVLAVVREFSRMIKTLKDAMDETDGDAAEGEPAEAEAAESEPAEGEPAEGETN